MRVNEREGAKGATRKVDDLAAASKARIQERQAVNRLSIKDADSFKAQTEMRGDERRGCDSSRPIAWGAR